MSFASYIKEIGRGEHGARDLSEADAQQLYTAMLDRGVPDLELGAILLALRIKTESLSELLGFYRATNERLHHLTRPASRLRPIVIPTYNGARHQANLLPLMALLLQRYGIPVLLHGAFEGHGRITTAHILRELGILPCCSLTSAQKALDQNGLAFVPTAVLSPGLANLLALRERLGVRSSAHSVVKLIDPFRGDGVRLVSVSHPAYLDKMREFFLSTGLSALLMRGTEGEPFANPKRRPKIERFQEGRSEVLFEAEFGAIKVLPDLPATREASTTAAWIKQALAGGTPIPHPLINQLVCCFYACGFADDLNQAKAIGALETGRLAAA